MSSVEDHYYKINRILLKMVGLWPYQDPRWTRAMGTFAISIFLSALFVQLAVLMTHQCTLDILIKVLSFTFPTFFMLSMYCLYYFNSDVMKKLIEGVSYDWKSFKNKIELDIMDDYANITKLFSQVFLFLLCCGMTATVMSHAVPMTLDIILPLNETRAQHIHILVEYFIDQSVYYHVPIFHLLVFCAIGMVTVMGTGMMLFGHGLHACALFKVANYRMELTIDNKILWIPSPERERMIHQRIINTVNVHRRAIEYCKLLMSSVERPLLVAIIIGVVSLSINLFRLLHSIIIMDEIVEIFIPCAMVFVHFCNLFLGNYIGQQITNNNAEIFDTVYNLPWYTVPRNIQMLLLFLLQKGTKNMYLSIGGVFNGSYEGFTTLSTSAISYFTVIYAIQ